MFLLFCFISCFPLVIVCKFLLFFGVSLVHPVVLSLSLSVVLSLCLSVVLSLCLSVLSLSLSIVLSLSLSVVLSLCLSVLSLSLSVVLVPALFPESSLVADSPDLTDFWDFKCYHPRANLGALWAATLSPFASESPTSLFSGRVSCPIVWTVCPPRPFVYPLFLINYIPPVHASGSSLDKPWH